MRFGRLAAVPGEKQDAPRAFPDLARGMRPLTTMPSPATLLVGGGEKFT